MGDGTSLENKKEPDCMKVMLKCAGELIYIFLYLAVLFSAVMLLIYSTKYGKIWSELVMFGIAWILYIYLQINF